MKSAPVSYNSIIAYFFLVVRALLAWMLMRYGLGKMMGAQFGVTPETLELPLKGVDLFRLSWYVADHEPFKSFIGLSQIIAGILLIWTKTRLIGAFIAIPIWLNILMWDMSFMGTDTPFTFRISFYLLLTLLIIWHQKEDVVAAICRLLSNSNAALRFPLWSYLLLPIPVLLLEFFLAVPSVVWNFIKSLN